MTDRSNNIRVPERLAGEPAASPAQLQRVRGLVTGMSLRGFRFDYRKLGAQQADAVIEQLERLRAASGVNATNPRKAGGCIGSAVRGAVTLVVALVVLAGVAAGGYLIYDRAQSPPGPAGSGTTTGPTQDPSPADRGNAAESEMFPGLGVGEPDRPERIEPEPVDSRAVETDRRARTPAPATADPATQRRTVEELDALESMLVQLSQFTRRAYDPPIRAQSSAGMLARLDGWTLAMGAIEANDPALAGDIRAVVSRYGEETIDGSAMREAVRSIRHRLRTLRDASDP